MNAAPDTDPATAILALRARLGLSQQQFADLLHVSKLTVLRWEHGRARPSARRLQHLAMLARGSDAFDAHTAATAAPLPPTGNLPAPGNRLIGREDSLQAALATLEQTRLLTLTGAGGSGKTRLALAVALAARPAYGDGGWLVELGSITAADLVPHVVAGTLGLRELRDVAPLSAIIAALRGRHLLLVLDNCEHLLEASATLARALLADCPGVQIIATSRELLAIDGEVVRQVEPLAVPAEDDERAVERARESAAVQLFVERATARRADFRLSLDNVADVAGVCRRLDGLPLALELAAARVAHMTVGAIAARLDDRFQLLVSGARTAPARQQTLYTAIDWSYALLSAPEQALFCALGVLPASFDLEAAAVVAAVSADRAQDLLGRLVDTSLVVAEERQGASRYLLLESLRAFARERLQGRGEAADTLDRHAAHVVARLRALLAGPRDLRSAWAQERFVVDRDDYRAVLRWLEEQERWTEYVALTVDLWRFWDVQGMVAEGQAWLRRGLERPPDGIVPPLLRARALNGLGQLYWQQGAYDEARLVHEQALQIAREQEDADVLARSLTHLALVAQARGEIATAQAFYEAALPAERSLGHPREIAQIVSNLGLLADRQGDLPRAITLTEEGAALRRQLGDTAGLSAALTNLATFAHARGDAAATRRYASEALELARGIGHRHVIAASLNNLAMADYRERDLAVAALRAQQAFEVYSATENRRGVATALSLQASIACAAGDLEQAADRHRRALTLRRAIGDPFETGESLLGLAQLAITQGCPARAAYLLGVVTTIMGTGTLPPGVEEFAGVRRAAEAALARQEFAQELARGAAAALAQVLDELLTEQPGATSGRAIGNASSVSPPRRITVHEELLLRLLAAGRSNKELARDLSISVRTVEREVTTLYAKLGVRGRVEATRYALQRDLNTA